MKRKKIIKKLNKNLNECIKRKQSLNDIEIGYAYALRDIIELLKK